MPQDQQSHKQDDKLSEEEIPFIRAANEDDDLYDPYSDKPPAPEPLFERDPWA